MKDAFGATYYLGTALLFISLFASLLAISLNYTKAFRIKNTIVSYIEKNDGCLQEDSNLREKISNYVNKNNYLVTNIIDDVVGNMMYESANGTTFVPDDGGCYDRGYCIYHYTSDGTSTNDFEYKGGYYKVVTYMQITFPFFGLNVTVPVTGETRLLSEKHGKCT